jgi:hypothetical protein
MCDSEHCPMTGRWHLPTGGTQDAVVETTLAILRGWLAEDEKTEGYRKDSSVLVATFELGEGDDPEQ